LRTGFISSRRLVYAASEVLTSQTKKLIKEAWGSEPFNQYVATETASIAAERQSNRRMRFFEDLVIAEIVDEQYRPVLSENMVPKYLLQLFLAYTTAHSL